jgi:hypothetical protein
LHELVFISLKRAFSDENHGISCNTTLPMSSAVKSPAILQTKTTKRAGEKTPQTLMKMMERHRENER